MNYIGLSELLMNYPFAVGSVYPTIHTEIHTLMNTTVNNVLATLSTLLLAFVQ